MDYKKTALEAHKYWRGKLEVRSRVSVKNKDDLSLAYTPGVALACLAVRDEPSLMYELTRKWNTVAVITDGSAVLGLGNIGPEAAMPVMEGKCVLFKEFADIDALPLCIDTNDTEKVIETIKLISKSFGGINLEDIAAPRCFEIEKRLREVCGIPVFHDDRHGTAIVTNAALINALEITGKNIKSCKVVVSGAGAAGTAVTKMLLSLGAGSVTVCSRHGILNRNDPSLDAAHAALAAITNAELDSGSLAHALEKADIFVGVSAGGIVTREMIGAMNKNPIVFAMANPVPEIMPEQAFEGGAAVVGTGRSDYPNQINNVLAFPGVFRGALDVRAKTINEEMEAAAALALASLARTDGLTAAHILPDAFDKRAAGAVARAVSRAAIETGVSQNQ